MNDILELVTFKIYFAKFIIGEYKENWNNEQFINKKYYVFVKWT